MPFDVHEVLNSEPDKGGDILRGIMSLNTYKSLTGRIRLDHKVTCGFWDIAFVQVHAYIQYVCTYLHV